MNSFTIQELALPGVISLLPKLFVDERGFSVTTYEREEFKALGIEATFVQEYVSFSKKDVIRGLHYQRAPHAQDKLIRCAMGRVLDVVADVDPASPNFGKHLFLELDAKVGELLFVPGTYAHGFCVLSEEGALVEYKMSQGYHPESAGGVRFDDPLLAISWPTESPIMSTQDASWPYLA